MKPDDRKCIFEYLSPKSETTPNVAFTPLALKWIKAMVEAHDGEVGFRGIVEEDNGAYVVTRIFYPKHCLVTSTTCEIAPEGEIEIAQKLLDEDRPDDVARVRFWGHSHHTMGTTPSGQDDTQAMEMMDKSGAYCIRAICAKSGEMSVSFFDYARQIKFENIKWTVKVNYDKIMDDIVIVVNEESPTRNKVKAIREILASQVRFTDDEYKEISEEIKKLKETQLPKINTYHQASAAFDHHHSRQYVRPPATATWPPVAGGFQQNMFNGRDEPPGFEDDEEYGRSYGYQSQGNRRKKGKHNDNQLLLTRQEIAQVVNNVWP